MTNPELSIVLDVPYYGRIAPDFDDIIFRYRTPLYDHIRYHTGAKVDAGDQVHYLMKIKALFVGAEVLDLLARHGIPETYVDKPTQTVIDAFDGDQLARFEAEFGDDTVEE